MTIKKRTKILLAAHHSMSAIEYNARLARAIAGDRDSEKYADALQHMNNMLKAHIAILDAIEEVFGTKG